MISKLARKDLLSLEQYAAGRDAIRASVMVHKKNRRVALGEHATLYFEDEQTIRYQIQEMLRIEKVFEVAGIQDELDAYNPLLPEGSNWKATFMLEYDDPVERKDMLAKLPGVEKQVWVQVAGLDKVWPIADEDLEREDEQKTSSVHFLRFELSPDMVATAISGAAITMGIDHPAYPIAGIEVAAGIRDSLVGDLVSAG